MKSVRDLGRLVEIIVRHHLPKKQVLWMEVGEYEETMAVFRNLGSSGTQSVILEGSSPELESVMVIYGGITFYIIRY